MRWVAWALMAVAVLVWPGANHRADDVGPAQPRGPESPFGLVRRWRRGGRSVAHAELGDAIALMAAPVRVGVTPASALRAAVAAMPVGGPLQGLFDDLVGAAARGESVAAVWLRHAQERGNADLRFVGQAWWLTEVTGAPLASALDTAEQVLRDRERSRQRLTSAVAGPRASMAVLALLPLCGPFVGLAFGVSPRALYLSSNAAMVSVALGVLIGLLAWWWSRRIIAGAIRMSTPRGLGPG